MVPTAVTAGETGADVMLYLRTLVREDDWGDGGGFGRTKIRGLCFAV